MSVYLVIGTRPELIKTAPVAFALKKTGIPFRIVNTAQHKDLLDPYWNIFGLKPDYSLDVMVSGQSLTSLTSRILLQLQDFLDKLEEKPALLMAQGDTTTVMGTAMLAFYNKIPFGHIEAGLRSFDLDNPFPEEYNRKVASITTQLHFAPTEVSRQNLLKENIRENDVYVVGNTVVDALQYISSTEMFKTAGFNNSNLDQCLGKDIVLITCHRRENHGENLNNIVAAVEELVRQYTQFKFVWLLHPNPNVKNVISTSKLKTYSNFVLTEPVDYWDLLKLLSQSRIILTDSGGIQEEAPSFGKPLIVLRNVTERPEAVLAGCAKLTGANTSLILETFEWAKQYKSSSNINPYGDGRAADRIAAIVKHFLR
ncbi:UDP-N-acetylglucosamine 2-epimerase (non-hydrolyzing) [Niastella caeni]|uniref:UDP-N-acetylglucosamine 2-epimerase (non-hydrolyzing) n=1 Tax=Niastella caeni TaxID=2569763 RepID=A0A4S8I1E6_9BACT|nr:UDP-N-acetylglucosamine 2-epimerase (non-hydrolyzing) [Niastella caeni]THU41511.1 UDP-N-acetylglucosamine 2-epimerase (non-hydrolyzing) [Niastella caeni]